MFYIWPTKLQKILLMQNEKKTLFGFGLVLIVEKTNNLVLVRNLVRNLVPKIRSNFEFNKLLMRTKINGFD